MTNSRRPRVAAIGLSDSQIASIEPLCGELRPARSLGLYLLSYSWTETDVVVAVGNLDPQVACSVNLLIIGPTSFQWSDGHSPFYGGHLIPHYAIASKANTERELTVSPSCPDLYKPQAVELSRHLSRSVNPPTVISTSRQGGAALIETTSGLSIALRFDLPSRLNSSGDDPPGHIALLLPEASNLVAWFRAFLSELHESDPIRVPQAPPRLSQPSDWYTPQESALAARISQVESEIDRLSDEQVRLQTELATEVERTDRGIRRALWADGDELVGVVRDILGDLGFEVRDMDAELSPGESKREDLRLTLQGVPGWEAIVEVKGYPSGTKTNDARQIREHRDRYFSEESRPPDLTVWLSNPYRTTEPSSRPAPDQNVKVAAENVGALHVLATDIYRQWALVAVGSLDAKSVVQSLVDTEPGLWLPEHRP